MRAAVLLNQPVRGEKQAAARAQQTMTLRNVERRIGHVFQHLGGQDPVITSRGLLGQAGGRQQAIHRHTRRHVRFHILRAMGKPRRVRSPATAVVEHLSAHFCGAGGDPVAQIFQLQVIFIAPPGLLPDPQIVLAGQILTQRVRGEGGGRGLHRLIKKAWVVSGRQMTSAPRAAHTSSIAVRAPKVAGQP